MFSLIKLKSLFILLTFMKIYFFCDPVVADIKPNDRFSAVQVVEIQLASLQSNSHDNRGIFQCWLFAHPDNKKYTGPLSRFISMIKSKPYDILLNSKFFKTKLIYENKSDAQVEVFLDSKEKNRYKILWTLTKSNINQECNDCWMTIGVSQPYKLGPII